MKPEDKLVGHIQRCKFVFLHAASNTPATNEANLYRGLARGCELILQEYESAMVNQLAAQSAITTAKPTYFKKLLDAILNRG